MAHDSRGKRLAQTEVGIEKDRWEDKTLRPHLRKNPERPIDFTTVSGEPVATLYTAEDVTDVSVLKDTGFPGEYPYTRGIHPNLYRGKLWTMRQFSGFGTPEETNERFKYLLAHGTTGLSVAFHLPTLMGIDSDHPRSLGEVGKCGVAIDSLKDMEALFSGIPLEKVTTSMTTNAPAPILFSMYIAVAGLQGVSPQAISGTIQNDILKEYIAQKTYIYPPYPSMRLITDIFGYASREVPRWNTISISGYHIREAGSTALQELAFTLRDGIEYVEWAIRAGLDVDEFAPRLSFFFNAHNDLFEEVAKYRAARRIWARVMKERFKAKNPKSLTCRFHTQTAGCSLTAQQPQNNIVRVAVQALAAILGGTNSLHTNSLDETLALPTEESVRIALRTQQILAYESGVVNTVDPLGGSYYVERLTKDMEEGAFDYFRKIDDMGGMVEAILQGFPQKEIAEASYQYQLAIEQKRKVIVGVNDFLSEEPENPEILYIDDSAEKAQRAKLEELRKTRDAGAVERSLEALRKAAEGTDNTMPRILEAVRSYATLGEICDTLRSVWGEYREPATY